MAATTIGECLTPTPTFTRSAQLERDIDDVGVLEHYHPTQRALAFVSRVLDAHVGKTANGAWTLSGPYGAGKSSCALFLAALLAEQNARTGTFARRRYREVSGEKTPKLQGYMPCLVTARREPLGLALLRALREGADRLWSGARGRKPAFLAKAAESLERGTRPSVDVVLECLDGVLKALAKRSLDGCLLVVDELGLALEFAGAHPDHSDLELLQLVAERAHKPQEGAARLFFVTILHQAFEDYARGLGQRERREWSKVQGRFEDVTLVDADQEYVRLVAQALRGRWPLATRRVIEEWAEAWATRAETLPALSDLGEKKERAALFGSCFPLDPIALMALPALSRRFAQNGRTLFAFVASPDPFGLCAAAGRCPLPTAAGEVRVVALPEVYDFFLESQNLVSLRPSDHALWCEVKDGVERCQALGHEAVSDLVRLAKSIAVLQLAAASGSGLRADPSTLQLAHFGAVSEEHGSKLSAMTSILAERGIIVYRRHSQSFHIWRGSDFDVEAALQSRRTTEDTQAEAIANINRSRLLPPIVAQRHYVDTGTLRYFQCLVTIESQLGNVLTSRDLSADGYVVLVLSSERKPDQLVEAYPELGTKIVLLGFPSAGQRVLELGTDLVGLTALASDKNRLKGDTTAQREIRARLSEIDRHLRDELDRCFDPNRTTWWRAGEKRRFESRRALRRELSVACDEHYPLTPRLHNDLINRRQLSSTSAAARGVLLARMLTHGDKHRLGVEGFPPEASMYASVLESTGIHAPDPEVTLFPGAPYQFGPPQEDGHPQLHELWQALMAFMDASSHAGRTKTVGDAFDLMAAPPFGLKAGMLPVLFLAAYLHRQHDVALYEGGSFVPALGADVLERLVKKPHAFSVRRFGVAGLRATIFHRFKALVGRDDAPASVRSLLLVVRPLLAFASHLPDYTRRTRSLGKETLAVREVLFSSRDPEQLLFVDLPSACGFEALLEGEHDDARAGRFFDVVQRCLRELRDAYDKLLENLRHVVLMAFGEDASSQTRARKSLARRAEKVRPHVTDPQLAPLLLRVADPQLADTEWAEALGALVLNKPAALWDDTSVSAFEARIADLAHRFERLERLTFELARQRGGGDQAEAGQSVRLTLTRLQGNELADVVRVDPRLEDDDLLEEVKALLTRRNEHERVALVAALAEWALLQRASNTTGAVQ